MSDDFENSVAHLPSDHSSHEVVVGSEPNEIVAYRNQLIKDHHQGSSGLINRIQESGGDTDRIVGILLEELFGETDALLGNGLVATNNGDLKDASVISVKRAEVLERAIKAIQAKQSMDKMGSGLDLDSPSMMVVFRYFMGKVKDVFDRMDLGSEVCDLFFKTLGDSTEEWKKEIRQELNALKGGK